MNASTSIMAAPAPIILQAPYSQVHVARSDADDHALMRARQLAELLLLTQPEEGPGNMLWLAQQLADELVATMEGMERYGGPKLLADGSIS